MQETIEREKAPISGLKWAAIAWMWIGLGALLGLRGRALRLWGWSPVIAVLIYVTIMGIRSHYDPYYNGVNANLNYQCQLAHTNATTGMYDGFNCDKLYPYDH